MFGAADICSNLTEIDDREQWKCIGCKCNSKK